MDRMGVRDDRLLGIGRAFQARDGLAKSGDSAFAGEIGRSGKHASSRTPKSQTSSDNA